MAEVTLRAAIRLEGLKALVAFEQITVECLIIEASQAYGNINLKVHPVNGNGYQNVDIGRVTIAGVPAVKWLQGDAA